MQKGIHESTEFLERFLRNLLLSENHELHNRAMHIGEKCEQFNKPDVDEKKPDIKQEKADIDAITDCVRRSTAVTEKTIAHIRSMYIAFGIRTVFGRTDVKTVTGLESSRASELINILSDIKLIEPVAGYGKGKYSFTAISNNQRCGNERKNL